MKKAALAGMLGAFILMAQAPGIRPRADANSYPVHQEQPDLSIGAALIPPEQVKKTFAANLNHGYVVVEVGVFPGQGRDVDLFPTDFTLWVGGSSMALRPVDADTIAEIMTGSHDRDHTPARSAPGGINTSAGVGIGRMSYPDPVTGQRRTSTVTETDAGVGVGGPAPRPCGIGYDCDSGPMPAPPVSQTSPIQNEHAISQELWEKSLPDGKTPHPVAGYLYFPKPTGKSKNAAWELRYEPASSERITLTLPR